MSKIIQTLQPLTSNFKNWSVAAIISTLLFLLLFKSCELRHAQSLAEQRRLPDTVFINKPYKVVVIKKEYIEKPVKVFVYLKDTTLRKEAEQSDIITAVHVKRKNLFGNDDIIGIDRITPKGIILSSQYETPAFREIKIDMQGNMQVKKKRFTKLKKIGTIVLISAAGFIIGKEISQVK
ncbi:MAG: hypothetical protein ACHQII_00270 [Bacteroidia bacterium]